MKKVLLITAALAVCSCSRNHAAYSVSDFLTDRNNALSYLSQSLAHAPQGTELSRHSSIQPPIDPSIPGDKHIKNVIQRQRWTGSGGHFISLKLSDELLSSADQGSSGTNTATQLLNHYFSGLRSLGFRNAGGPGGGWDGNVLYSSNVWFRQGSSNITIFGQVYVDPKDKIALVAMQFSEWY